MLIAVRHGSTNLNGESGDDKFRGWLNLHLSSKGEEEAKQSAEELKSLLGDSKVDSFHTSDLLRAKQTAKVISNEIGVDAQPTKYLRDWDIGEFEGKNVKDHLAEIHKYLDNPDESIPDGESFSSFYDRTSPILKSLVEDDKTNIAVVHNRLTTLLRALAKNKGDHPNLSLLKQKGPVEPGGILVVNPDWSFHTV